MVSEHTIVFKIFRNLLSFILTFQHTFSFRSLQLSAPTHSFSHTEFSPRTAQRNITPFPLWPCAGPTASTQLCSLVILAFSHVSLLVMLLHNQQPSRKFSNSITKKLMCCPTGCATPKPFFFHLVIWNWEESSSQGRTFSPLHLLIFKPVLLYLKTLGIGIHSIFSHANHNTYLKFPLFLKCYKSERPCSNLNFSIISTAPWFMSWPFLHSNCFTPKLENVARK